MPYTPPNQSPVLTTGARTSYMEQHPTAPMSPPTIIAPTSPISEIIKSGNPPKSATYLYRHKRSSSISGPITVANPEASTRSNVLVAEQQQQQNGRSPSLRQSPPPVTDSQALIPTGAMLSPPESPVGSDDEIAEVRRNEKREQALDELKKAVSVIPQAGSSSRFTPPEEPQKLGHSRSRSAIVFPTQPESNAVSDTEEDPPRIAPPMVRKKSGEIVKSSLKSGNRPRPVSMPSTPTYPKVVHFDSHLEHVRHFNFQEKPAAVSASSSPVEQIDHDHHGGYPFPGEEKYEWEIGLPNFPQDSPERRLLPVRLERVYLSTDKQSLMGSVAVANIAFQKAVAVRFTLDYWRTVSEVTAEFSNDVRRRQKEDNMDRFTFCIGLGDQVNLHKKTLFFCVRYNTAGQEFWDNNNNMNFQVDFKKKQINLPASQWNGFLPPLSSLPRSKSAVTLSTSRRHENDDFRNAISFKPEPLELPKKKPEIRRASEDETTVLPVRKSAPANAFSNRYDFGASLNATIKGSKQDKRGKRQEDVNGNINNGSPIKPVFFKRPERTEERASSPMQQAPQSYRFADAKQTSSSPIGSPSMGSPVGPALGEPPKSFINGKKPPIQSLSYRELLDNYCFFGSAPTSTRTSPDHSYTDLFSLRTTPTTDPLSQKHTPHSLPAYTLVAPRSPPRSPTNHLNHNTFNGIEIPSQSLRWSPISSPKEKKESPVAVMPQYNYQRRRHGGGVGGFGMDSAAVGTVIRG